MDTRQALLRFQTFVRFGPSGGWDSHDERLTPERAGAQNSKQCQGVNPGNRRGQTDWPPNVALQLVLQEQLGTLGKPTIELGISSQEGPTFSMPD